MISSNLANLVNPVIWVTKAIARELRELGEGELRTEPHFEARKFRVVVSRVEPRSRPFAIDKRRDYAAHGDPWEEQWPDKINPLFEVVADVAEMASVTEMTTSPEMGLTRISVRFQAKEGDRVRFGDAGNAKNFADWGQLAKEIYEEGAIS